MTSNLGGVAKRIEIFLQETRGQKKLKAAIFLDMADSLEELGGINRALSLPEEDRQWNHLTRTKR